MEISEADMPEGYLYIVFDMHLILNPSIAAAQKEAIIKLIDDLERVGI